MAFNSPFQRWDRKEILRGVYEDNLRTTQQRYVPLKPNRPSGEKIRPRRAFLTGSLSAVFGLFLLLAAALAATDQNASHSSEQASRTSEDASLSMEGAFLTSNEPSASSEKTSLAPEKGSLVPGSLADVTGNGAPRRSESVMQPVPSVPPDGTPTVAELYGLHRETIVIDAGHGGRDPGATGRHGLQEKEVTLDVARRLKKRLERYPGYRILLTRDRDDTMLLRDRIEFSNRSEADLFVSIHVNWLPVDSIAPIETYYYGPDSDPRAMRLAQRENRNSGYSVAEFNDLTQRLRLDLKMQESKDAAHAIQEGLISGLRNMGRDVSDWGAKSSDFMVLLGVEAPSILAEIGSLSNSDEESQLNTVSYREKLAYLLERGIANYLEQPTHESKTLKHGSEEENEGI